MQHPIRVLYFREEYLLNSEIMWSDWLKRVMWFATSNRSCLFLPWNVFMTLYFYSSLWSRNCSKEVANSKLFLFNDLCLLCHSKKMSLWPYHKWSSRMLAVRFALFDLCTGLAISDWIGWVSTKHPYLHLPSPS